MKDLVLTLFIVFVSSALGYPSAEMSHTEHEASHLECVNGTLQLNHEIMEKTKVCVDPEIYGTEPGKKHPNCRGLCVANVLGLLGEDGLPHKEKQDHWIHTEFPICYRRLAHKHMNECYESHGSKIDLTDNSCTEAFEYHKCSTSFKHELVC